MISNTVAVALAIWGFVVAMAVLALLAAGKDPPPQDDTDVWENQHYDHFD